METTALKSMKHLHISMAYTIEIFVPAANEKLSSAKAIVGQIQ